VTRAVLVRLKEFSLKRSTAGAFEEKYDRRQCFVLEVVPLRGEDKFKPHPQNRILVFLRGCF